MHCSGPNDDVIRPKHSTKMDWEAEIGIVVGTKVAASAPMDEAVVEELLNGDAKVAVEMLMTLEPSTDRFTHFIDLWPSNEHDLRVRRMPMCRVDNLFHEVRHLRHAGNSTADHDTVAAATAQAVGKPFKATLGGVVDERIVESGLRHGGRDLLQTPLDLGTHLVRNRWMIHRNADMENFYWFCHQ